MRCKAHYAQEMFFQFIKKDEKVVGFMIASHKSASGEVKTFCRNLMSLLDQGSLRMVVFPQGQSMIIYNPLRVGENRRVTERVVKFPLGQEKEAKQLKEILFNPEVDTDTKTIGHDEIYGFQLTI